MQTVIKIKGKARNVFALIKLMAEKQPNETIGHIAAKQKVGR